MRNEHKDISVRVREAMRCLENCVAEKKLR
jgi:hypothetical protein